MSITLAGTSLILGTAAPLPLALAILASQLPDIDTTTSTIDQIGYPIAGLRPAIPRHHDPWLSYSLGLDWKLGLALPLGHLLDCFTKLRIGKTVTKLADNLADIS